MRGRALIVAVVFASLAAGPAAARPATLRPFSSCSALLGYARAHATRALKTGWTPGPIAVDGPRPVFVSPAKGGTTNAPQAAVQEDSGAAGSPSFSTTNVQEQGVDEPDVVKTDGTTLFAVANGVLHAVDTSGDAPRLVGTLALDEGYGHELLLHGDRLLVLQTAWLTDPDGGGRAVTRLTEVDVSDPSDLRVVRRERDDGEYVSARMTGATVRVVLASRAPVMTAVEALGAPTRRAAIDRRLRRMRRARLAAWQPHTYFHDARRGTTRFHALTRCGQVRHAPVFSGLDTITILTVDMAHGLPAVDADAVMSDAQIVYASPDRLFVATQRWFAPQLRIREQAPPTTTEINAFDTSDPDRTSYVATGQVSGFLLNQFAMSEYKGVLRVASTETPSWWEGGDSSAGEGSAVTTLDASSLQQLGRVGGLGRGERIYAVRFVDDVGYVVTFRQVDPLYVLDLAKPAEPRVAGELKLAGYSAYLHPIGKDLVLGVGQDAGADGRTTGTQLSLFDVSDPASPTRLAQHAIAGGNSTAEYDHHAFLYWPATKLAVVPLTVYDGDNPPFTGAVGLRIERSGIDEVGRIGHPHDTDALWEIQRATVIGEHLFTLSSAGVLSSALDTLAAGPFVGFPDKPTYSGGCGGGGGGPGPETLIACPVEAGPAR